MYDASKLLKRAVVSLPFLPKSHLDGLEKYVKALQPLQSNPHIALHTTLVAIQSTVQGLLSALARPSTIIGQMVAAKREADRNDNSISKSSRWPLGLLDDTRQRIQEDKEKRAQKWRTEVSYLARELRYTQQTVAGEMAGWQSLHDTMGRRAIRDYARGMVLQERMRLDGLQRALRTLRAPDEQRSARDSGNDNSPWSAGHVTSNGTS